MPYKDKLQTAEAMKRYRQRQRDNAKDNGITQDVIPPVIPVTPDVLSPEAVVTPSMLRPYSKEQQLTVKASKADVEKTVKVDKLRARYDVRNYVARKLT